MKRKLIYWVYLWVVFLGSITGAYQVLFNDNLGGGTFILIFSGLFFILANQLEILYQINTLQNANKVKSKPNKNE